MVILSQSVILCVPYHETRSLSLQYQLNVQIAPEWSWSHFIESV